MVFIHLLESSYDSEEDDEENDNDSFISYGSYDNDDVVSVPSSPSDSDSNIYFFEGVNEDFEESSSDLEVLASASDDADEEDERMSQASTVVNEDLEPAQSGTDTEDDEHNEVDLIHGEQQPAPSENETVQHSKNFILFHYL